jgi:TP901 family phage tail tape measure protein
MGPKVGKSPQELAEALYFVASAGVKGAAALDVVRVSAKASAGGLGETQTVADAVTSAMNAYGQKNMTAAHAADVLTATVREGKGEAAAFAPVIGNVANIAANLGVRFEDVGGALAGMTRLGVDASTAATQLQATFSSLMKVTPASADALKKVGLSAQGLRDELATKGLLPTLQTLKDAFHGNTVEMEKVFPNIRAFKGVLALVGKGADETAALFARMAKSTGATQVAFEAATGTMAFKWKQASAQIQASAIGVGNALAPTIISLTGFVGRLAQSFQNLSPETQKMIGIGVAIAAALGPLIGLFGNLALAIKGVATVAGFMAAGSPLALGILVLGTIVGALAYQFLFAKSTSEQLSASLQSLRDAINGTKDAVNGIANADMAAQSAKLRVIETMHAEQLAHENLTKVRANSKSTTLETAVAEDAYKRAVLEHTTAVQANNAATTQQAEATKKLIPPITDHIEKLGKQVSAAQQLIDKYEAIHYVGDTVGKTQAAVAVVLGKTTATLQAGAEKAQTLAVKMAGINTPAALAAIKVRDLDSMVRSFIITQGRLPTKTEMEIIVKKLNLRDFGTELDKVKTGAETGATNASAGFWTKISKIPTDAATTGKSATSKMKATLAPLGGIGASAGAALSSGLASGINGSAAIAKAQGIVNQIKAIMSTNFGSTPDVWAKEHVGSPLIRGIAEGIVASEGLATKAAEQHKQRLKAIFQATQIVADMQAAGQIIGTTFANSIIGGLIQKTPSVVQQANQISTQIAQLGPAIAAAGKTIGLAHAQGIIAGMLGAQPSVVAQGKQLLNEAVQAQLQKIKDAKAAFVSAFSDLANAALAAFDKKMADWKPPSGTLLEAFKLQDQIGQMTDGLGPAVNEAEQRLAAAFTSGNKQAIDQAQNDLDAALTNSFNAVDFNTTNMLNAAQATLAQAQAEGDPDKIATAQAAYDQALKDRTDALNQNNADQRTLIEANLQYRADAEQRTHDAIAAKQREGLAKQLFQLETWLLKHPAKWREMAAKVQAILNDPKYKITLEDSGKAWANKFASGITAGIPAAVKAAKAMAAAVDKVIPHSPAKEGPLAYDIFDVGKKWATQFGQGIAAGAKTPSIGPAAGTGFGVAQGIAGMGRTMMGSAMPVGAAAGGGGGAPVINVYVSGTVVTENQLVDAVYRGLVRKSGRNAGNLGLA